MRDAARPLTRFYSFANDLTFSRDNCISSATRSTENSDFNNSRAVFANVRSASVRASSASTGDRSAVFYGCLVVGGDRLVEADLFTNENSAIYQ